MDVDFWKQIWVDGNTMFHSTQTNPYLMKFWPRFELAQGTAVFVPLAGKSLDLIWLAEQGYRVIGVELSEIAVEAFFKENGLAPTITQEDQFSRWESGMITMLCGDFFDLTAGHLAGAKAVYDRASMVALPPEMRMQYAQHLADLLPEGGLSLLIVFEYDQTVMAGPPFAIASAEVQAVYQDNFLIEHLQTKDILSKAPLFQRHGAKKLDQVMYRLIRR